MISPRNRRHEDQELICRGTARQMMRRYHVYVAIRKPNQDADENRR